jgi:hypothetical protein
MATQQQTRKRKRQATPSRKNVTHKSVDGNRLEEVLLLLTWCSVVTTVVMLATDHLRMTMTRVTCYLLHQQNTPKTKPTCCFGCVFSWHNFVQNYIYSASSH